MKPQLSIKILIWVYLVLLIFEGSLRKWILPGLSAPLLVVRDPVLLAIYAIAWPAGLFPSNKALTFVGILAGISALFCMVFGHGNVVVMFFGIRANYLHLPLIWIMGSTLTRKDLLWMGGFLMAVSIPNTALMIKQYNAPADDWINWGAGGAGTGQISGAGEHIRPAGFFSFISGPAALYPLVTAFVVFSFLSTNHLWRIVAAGAGVATAVAIPVSISRSVFLAVLIVAAAGAICALLSGKIATNIIKVAVLVGLLAVAVPRIGVFHEALLSFTERWEVATGDVKEDIGLRWASTFLEAFDAAGWAPFFGNGIGSGTNVASGVAVNQSFVFFGEGEWGRAVTELGPLLGFFYLGFRTWLTFHLVLAGIDSWKRRSDPLAILLCSAGAMNVIIGQWGIPTSLGFSIFGAGLIMVAAKNTTETELSVLTPPAAPEHTAAKDKTFPVDNDRRPPVVKKPAHV